MSLEFITLQCPYCGENIDIDVEPGDDAQEYIQDCSVCCRPIALTVEKGDEGIDVTATRTE